MLDNDKNFTGTVPENYDRYLRHMLFVPYAKDLAERLAAMPAGSVLEIACGTGAVTQELRKRLAPSVDITATDLNRDMLSVAVSNMSGAQVAFAVADAQSLPYADATFDAIVCQFGVMFFSDQALAFREMYRVLKPGGRILFNVWDKLKKNPISYEMARAIDAAVPEIAPCFTSRVPFSNADYRPLVDLLKAAGFESVDVDTVEKESRATSAQDAMTGYAEGSPMRAELNSVSPEQARRGIEAATRCLQELFGMGAISAPMSAHVLQAVRPSTG